MPLCNCHTMARHMFCLITPKRLPACRPRRFRLSLNRASFLLEVNWWYTILDMMNADFSLVTARATGDDFTITNGMIQVTVSKKGRITSLYDMKLKRELIEEGKSAGFVMFEDKPLNWDAWSVRLAVNSQIASLLTTVDRPAGMSTYSTLKPKSISMRRRSKLPKMARSRPRSSPPTKLVMAVISPLTCRWIASLTWPRRTRCRLSNSVARSNGTRSTSEPFRFHIRPSI